MAATDNRNTDVADGVVQSFDADAGLPPASQELNATIVSDAVTAARAVDTVKLRLAVTSLLAASAFKFTVDGKALPASATVKVIKTAAHSEIVVITGAFGSGEHTLEVTTSAAAKSAAPVQITGITYDKAVYAAQATLAAGKPAQFSVAAQLITSPAAASDVGGPSGQGGSLLPSGYLSTKGNQIVDSAGNPVRIASIGWSGTDSLTFAPWGLWQSSIQQNMEAIKADGFNTVRIPWSDLLLSSSPEFTSTFAAFNPALDPELVGATGLQLLDTLVAGAAKLGLKIIFDHHDDDGGPGGLGGQQSNGLWFDSGPGTDGTDGSGTAGTVTAAKFLADSATLAEHFAGNATVIGFDLDNEPTSAGGITWGQGGPTDIQAMYTQVGDAIQAVDPGALIIAEGPEEWSGPAPGMPAGFAEGDLSGVATNPVALTIPDKVVYSVHEYPPDLSNNGSYDPAQQIAMMNAGWGYLEADNIAPVWIGEIGSNLSSVADQAWIDTVVGYANGQDGGQGGPNFSGAAQPVSTSWWQWGAYPGTSLEGVETGWGSGQYWPAQQAVTDQLLYVATGLPDPSSATISGGPTSGLTFLQPATGSVALSSTLPSSAGGVITATVSNLGTTDTNGWAVEFDTGSQLTAVTGGVLTNQQPGIYLLTPSVNDSAINAGGMVSFSVAATAAGTTPTITAHLVTAA